MSLLNILFEVALVPSNLLIAALLLGFALVALRRKRSGIALGCLATLALAAAAWSPLGPAAVIALEDRFPTRQPPAAFTGVIVLGGVIDTHLTADRGVIALTSGAERFTVTAELAQTYPSMRIFLSGGAGDGDALTESAAGKRLLIALGVPAARIEMEEISTTTCENARETKRALAPQPGETWLLVTSALHMPRAVACFEAVEFPILPYPVDFQTRRRDLVRPVTVASGGLALVDAAAHEWLGLLAYRLGGKTRTLFPGPAPTPGGGS